MAGLSTAQSYTYFFLYITLKPFKRKSNHNAVMQMHRLTTKLWKQNIKNNKSVLVISLYNLVHTHTHADFQL